MHKTQIINGDHYTIRVDVGTTGLLKEKQIVSGNNLDKYPYVIRASASMPDGKEYEWANFFDPEKGIDYYKENIIAAFHRTYAKINVP